MRNSITPKKGRRIEYAFLNLSEFWIWNECSISKSFLNHFPNRVTGNMHLNSLSLRYNIFGHNIYKIYPSFRFLRFPTLIWKRSAPTFSIYGSLWNRMIHQYCIHSDWNLKNVTNHRPFSSVLEHSANGRKLKNSTQIASIL